MHSAFLSYVRDANEGNVLGQLAERLAARTRVAGVQDFQVFRDETDIRWGEEFQRRVEDAVKGALVFLPVIVPAYFQREWCRRELSSFIEVERNRERRDLIFPILWMDCHGLSPTSDDPLMSAIASRQYVDWREIQYDGLDTGRAKREIDAMAQRLAARLLGRPDPTDARGPRVEGPQQPNWDPQPVERLLLSLFSADELRRFLRYGSRSASIEARLPGAQASPAELAHRAVIELVRDGALDDEFLNRLIQERPGRRKAIDEVRPCVSQLAGRG